MLFQRFLRHSVGYKIVAIGATVFRKRNSIVIAHVCHSVGISSLHGLSVGFLNFQQRIFAHLILHFLFQLLTRFLQVGGKFHIRNRDSHLLLFYSGANAGCIFLCHIFRLSEFYTL